MAFVYEHVLTAFSMYAPDDIREKYQAFQERYTVEQRKTLQTLYCNEVDGLILKMIRTPDDLGKAILANAPDLLQCLVASRHIAVLKYFKDTQYEIAEVTGSSLGPDEILAAFLLSFWYSYLKDEECLYDW
jgi:hypothetical protein